MPKQKSRVDAHPPRTLPSRLKVALSCARRGWPVIPLYSVENGQCSCSEENCTNPGKHPLTVNGIKNATTDDTWIRTWWEEFPEANIGVATGAPSGIVVLDIDPRHGGDKSLRELENKYGPMPDGPRVRTGGGGQHLYLSHPGNSIKSQVGLLPGVDVRGDGGCVVGVGSNHSSGKLYLWEGGKTPGKLLLPPMPSWLHALGNNGPAPQQQTNIPIIPESQRNSTLTSLAGTMRNRGLSPAAIEAALLVENRLRCKPPLNDAEVSRISASIGRCAPGNLPSGSLPPARTPVGLVFHNGAEIENAVAEKIPWVVEPYVAVGAITDISGKVKLAGKTTFALDMVRNVMQGTDFMEWKTLKTPVVYLTEQPKVTFREAMKRAGLLGKRDFHVLFRSEAFGVSWHEVAGEAVRKCEATGSKPLVTDTLPQFAGLIRDAENDSGAALAAIEPLQMAAARGIGILTISHNRKGGGALGDARRGSSAFAGAVDVLCGLQRPEGNGPRNRRLLSAVSRFDGTPEELLIELRDDGYHSLGEPGEAAKEQVEREVLAALPHSKSAAADISALGKKTTIRRSQLQRVLDALEKKGLVHRTGKGVKKDPVRYFADSVN
jgi:Bifunctional DNA primase/polymerase, N-terminal/AAA domain/Primase C terminal 1 (PriCT-1)